MNTNKNDTAIRHKMLLPAILLVAAGIYFFAPGEDEDIRPEQKTVPIQVDTDRHVTGVPALPTGPVILTVHGVSQNQNSGNMTHFDRDMLLAFPQVSHVVTTPWTEGDTTFSGPLLMDVLRYLGADGAVTISAKALNDYQIEIPVSDARQYPVILALQQNGKNLAVRDKGPVWIIYPWTTDRPELQAETYHSRSIWQLTHIGIK